MARKLHDIQPGEVSLVHRGANRRRFLLAKSGEVEFDETIAKILDEPATDEAEVLERVRKAGGEEDVLHSVSAYLRLRESLSEGLLKAITPAQADEDEENANGTEGTSTDKDDEDEELAKSYESLLKRDFTDEQRKTLAESGVAMSTGSYPIENAADLKNAIHAVGRGKAPHAEIQAHIKKRAKALGAEDQLPDEWKVNKEDGMSETAQAVPVKKDDGSWDLTGVPEDQRAAVEAVIKANDAEKAELIAKAEEQATKAENAEKIAKEERDVRETRDYIAKSQDYKNLAKSDDEFGPVLKSIANAERDGALPEGTASKLDEVLKAADEQVKAGDLFKEAGRAGHGTGSNDHEAKVKTAVTELRKSDPKLTDAQAISKAYANDPDLYDEYQKEVA